MHKGLLEALGRRQRELDAKGEGDVDAAATWASSLKDKEQGAVLNAVFDRVNPKPAMALVSHDRNVWNRGGRRAWLGSMAAAAAVILLWIGWQGLKHPLEVQRSMPPYSIVAFTGGISEFRSTRENPSAELTLSPNDPIDWKFAPLSSVQEGVEVGVIAKSEKGETQWSTLEGVEVSATGSVRMYGPLSSFVNLYPGKWTLVLYFSLPGELPQHVGQVDQVGPWQKTEVRLNVTLKP